MIKLQRRHGTHRGRGLDRGHAADRRRAHLRRAGLWVPIVTGVGLAATAGVGAGQAWHRLRERRWLREEIALLPFPVRRDAG